LRPANNDALRQLACDPLNEASVYLNQRGNESIHLDLANISTPVTLLRAPLGEDSMSDLSASPTWPGLAKALPNCEEVFLPDLNHFIPMQDPALVARYVKAVV
jgi:pimeloyl-ACP methyl ester carboxylesterase